MRRLAYPLLTLLLASCAGANSKPATQPTTTPVARNAAGDASIRALVLEMARADACEKLRGKLVGLGDKSDAQGEARGLVPVSGRWLVRDCKASIENDALKLHIGGVGWQWVDQSKGGFAIKQYIYFSASVDLEGELDIGFDAASKIATVWISPKADIGARIDALGDVNVKAENLWGGVLSGLAKAVGKDLGDVAKKKIGTEGASMMKERLAEGFTLTFDTRKRQIDMIQGALPKGSTPKRPFDGDDAWMLNERQRVFQGGVQFAGPYSPAARVLFDANVEAGEGFSFALVCAADARNAVDAVVRGESPPSFARARNITRGEPAKAVVLSPPPCPWALVTYANDQAGATIALRLRPTDATTPADAQPTIGSAWARLTLLSFEIEPKKPNGKRWDVLGDPDPSFWVRAGDGSRQVFVAKMKDTLRASPMAQAPLLELSATSPLRLGAVDIDPIGQEDIGEVSISLDELRRRGTEFDVELKLGDHKTAQARVRVEWVGRP